MAQHAFVLAQYRSYFLVPIMLISVSAAFSSSSGALMSVFVFRLSERWTDGHESRPYPSHLRPFLSFPTNTHMHSHTIIDIHRMVIY
jgi:hypothetical protein